MALNVQVPQNVQTKAADNTAANANNNGVTFTDKPVESQAPVSAAPASEQASVAQSQAPASASVSEQSAAPVSAKASVAPSEAASQAPASAASQAVRSQAPASQAVESAAPASAKASAAVKSVANNNESANNFAAQSQEQSVNVNTNENNDAQVSTESAAVSSNDVANANEGSVKAASSTAAAPKTAVKDDNNANVSALADTVAGGNAQTAVAKNVVANANVGIKNDDSNDDSDDNSNKQSRSRIFAPLNLASDGLTTDGKAEDQQGTLYGTGNEVKLPGKWDEGSIIETQHMWSTVNGKTADAWCLQPLANGPLEIDKSKQAKIDYADITDQVKGNNELMGVIYYGYQGPKCVVGNTDQDYLYTHIAASVAAWDTNFDGIRDYESSKNTKWPLSQATIDKWRQIPEVAKILNAAKGFNQGVMDKDGYTFTAYNGHGVGADGKVLPDSQDVFMVSWAKKPTPKPAPAKPSMGTTLVGSNGQHTLDFSKSVTAVDHCNYSGLQGGQKYTLKGTLMDKKTGKPVMNNGKPVTATTTFTADKSGKGTADVKFTFDDTGYANDQIVAYEDLTDAKGNVVVKNENINDNNEMDTVTGSVSTTHSTATSTSVSQTVKTSVSTSQSHSVSNSAPITIKTSFNNGTLALSNSVTAVDKVMYQGLKPGQTYTMRGTLMDKNTGKPVMNNGKPVTVEQKFTPKTANGEVDIKFTLNDTQYAGQQMVAYEDLLDASGKVISSHDDINDKAETATVSSPKPSIGTTLVGTDGQHTLPISTSAVATDQVKYTGLTPGQTYTMRGTLMDKKTGKPVMNNGKPVVVEQKFTPKTANGEVDIKFTLNDTDYAGDQLVAYEDLLDNNGKVIVSHDNINDTAETDTVASPKPTIGTTLVGSNGQHVLPISKETTATDTIRYTGLTPGQTYKIVGTLMDKKTGKPVMNNGKPVTVTSTFVPKTANGETTVTFHFDDTNYAGDQLVAYEDLYDNKGNLIASHDNINDTAETDTVASPKKPVSPAKPSSQWQVQNQTVNVNETPETIVEQAASPVAPVEEVASPVASPVASSPVEEVASPAPVQEVAAPAPAAAAPAQGQGVGQGMPATGMNNSGLIDAELLTGAGMLVAGIAMKRSKKESK